MRRLVCAASVLVLLLSRSTTALVPCPSKQPREEEELAPIDSVEAVEEGEGRESEEAVVDGVECSSVRVSSRLIALAAIAVAVVDGHSS